MLGAAAWPRRSSGAESNPIFLRWLGLNLVILIPLKLMLPCCENCSPDKTANNSSCPLPATPPIPSISPCLKSNVTLVSEVPNWLLLTQQIFSTFSITCPAGLFNFSGALIVEPTIISANFFVLVFSGVQVSTFFPRRKIVAVSHNFLISSNL